MPTACWGCCRAGIARSFTRICNAFSSTTGSRSTAPTNQSNLSISLRRASAPCQHHGKRRCSRGRTIGNEGVVGLPLLLGDDRAPPSVYVQVPGAGLRMKAVLFKRELARSASMRAVMLRYAHAFFNQIAQSAACNHFHTLEQRCCRRPLMAHDRMHSNEFLLTQEFLAVILGVQRTGVTAAAGALQRVGLPLQAWQRHDPRSPRPHLSKGR
jgi:hypothetical protein